MEHEIYLLKNYLEEVLKLEYLPDGSFGNLCFVHENPELRTEFRVSFRRDDILRYLKNSTDYPGIQDSDFFFSDIPSGIIFPKNPEIFWRVINSD